MKRSRVRQCIYRFAIVAAGAIIGNAGTYATASADEVCWDFEAHALGNYTSPYDATVGSAPFFHGVYRLTNRAGSANFELVTHNGSKAMEPYTDPPGNPDVWFRIEAWHDGSRPTVLTFDLGAFNGNVTVIAYDDTAEEIWSDVFAAEANHVVDINGVGAIDYVEVFGGDREVFVDDICIAIP